MSKTPSKVTLPKSFAPYQADSLIRIGRANDGGYLIDSRNPSNSSVLIGMGLSDDWSFEYDFRKIKKVPIYAYDASVSKKIFIKKFIRSLFKFRKFRDVIRNWRVLRSYQNFFSDDVKHIAKYVGVNPDKNFITLKSILDGIDDATKQRIFLKIDIEGAEYRLLDEILNYSSLIEGMVIEFHDVDLHVKRIEEFIDKFSLKLIHTHSNNCSFISKNNLPTAIECTFTSRPTDSSRNIRLPHTLDMPCCLDCPDHEIVFTE